MKKTVDNRIYLCSICGKEIKGNHVMIRTRRHTELHIHYECMPGKGARRNADQNEEIR